MSHVVIENGKTVVNLIVTSALIIEEINIHLHTFYEKFRGSGIVLYGI